LAAAVAQGHPLFFISFDLETAFDTGNVGGRLSAHHQADGVSPTLVYHQRILRIFH
jgi:hypothetical protein